MYYMNGGFKKALFGSLLLIGIGIGMMPVLFDKVSPALPSSTPPSHAAAPERAKEQSDRAEEENTKSKATPSKPPADHEYSMVLTERALDLIKAGKSSEAVTMFERAIFLDDSNQTAKDQLAKLQGKGDDESAPSPTPSKTPHPDAPDRSAVPDSKPASELKPPPQKSPLPTPEPTVAKKPSPKPTAKPSPKISATPEAKPNADPAFAAVMIERGIAQAKAEALSDAIKLFEKAVAADPGDPVARRGLLLLNEMASHRSYRSTGQIPEELLAQFLFEMTGMLETAVSPTPVTIAASPIKTPSPSPSAEPEGICATVGERIEQNFFEHIALSETLPTRFRVGEIVTISGVVESSDAPDQVMAFYTPISDPKAPPVAITAPVKKKLFDLHLYFPTAGEYQFSLCPGTSCAAKAHKIIVTEAECVEDRGIVHPRPTGLLHQVENGLPLFSWQDDSHQLFQLEFSQEQLQKTFYVHNRHEFFPPLSAFQEFEPGPLKIRLSAAVAGRESIDRRGEWIGAEASLELTAVPHINRQDNFISSISLNDGFQPGETISFAGKTEAELDSNAVVIDPDDNIFEVPLTREKSAFFGEIPNAKAGSYLLEINQKDKLSLFVGGVVSSGLSPILPDYFDLDSKPQALTTPLDPAQLNAEMLKLINRERATRRLDLLKSDTGLIGLADFRAQDMCTRDYFGHVDPDGKTAGDHREKFAITRAIGENLAESGGVESAHNALMRSPAHRELIVDPDAAAAGFGFCLGRAEPEQLTVVQIFGE